MKHFKPDPWAVQEDDLDRTRSPGYETIFAQANGYRCLRGASPFLPASLPGNFIAGVFDKSEAPVTELVNGPDPLPVTVYVDYEAVERGSKGLSGYSRRFDLKRGEVVSTARYQSAPGAVLELSCRRLVSHADRSRWAEEWSVTPQNFSRRILVKSVIDGRAVSGAWHPLDATRHFEVTDQRFLADSHGLPWGLCLVSRTRDHGIEAAEAVTLTGPQQLKLIKVRQLAERLEAVWSLDLKEGHTVVFQRLGVTVTSRDPEAPPGSLIAARAESALRRFAAEGYTLEAERHEQALDALWSRIDVGIDGDDRAQRALRYNLFQLASSAHPTDDRVSIAAKALHGEGYKGHVFWDTETFMLPFFTFTQPDVARTLLGYRCRTIEGARRNATAGGYQGARFPWESADDGTETTPTWGVDYAGNHVRIWTGDIEVHINSDITYAVLKYLQVTGDESFLMAGGLSVLFQIARFWTSFVTFDARKNAYEIKGVIGPDEFHEHVDNNTYTNYLVKWALLKTADLADRLKQSAPDALAKVMDECGVTAPDVARWREVAGRIGLLMDPKGGLIEQFEGYFGLTEHAITEWDENGMPVWPKGVDVSKLGKTTLIKQPDVIMLFALLGEEFSRETKVLNYEFYEQRTMHKSSLSPSMYAMVGLSIGKDNHAYDYFMKAAETDLVDNQGNNSLGLHAANMGGVWQTAVFGFGGLSADESGPQINPWLPPQWKALSYRFVWRGTGIRVAVDPQGVTVESEAPLTLVVRGKTVSAGPGKPGRVDLTGPALP